MTRDKLLSLKAKKDEEVRQNRIEQIVKTIYANAVRVAEETARSSYEHQVPLSNVYSTSRDPCPFHMDNMNEILTRLQKLFPDAVVNKKRLIMSQNKILYEHARIDSADALLLCELYIVIDWT